LKTPTPPADGLKPPKVFGLTGNPTTPFWFVIPKLKEFPLLVGVAFSLSSSSPEKYLNMEDK
jgi:hypothetical protein